jgi:hypothetical protein
MLSSRFISNLKNLNKSIFKNSKKFFAVNTSSLKSVLKEEISSEEKGYTPVDKTELTQFYESTKFKFVEDDSTKMELRKVENGNEITVSFFSKPPTPQPEQDPNNQEDMGKLKNLFNY